MESSYDVATALSGGVGWADTFLAQTLTENTARSHRQGLEPSWPFQSPESRPSPCGRTRHTRSPPARSPSRFSYALVREPAFACLRGQSPSGTDRVVRPI